MEKRKIDWWLLIKKIYMELSLILWIILFVILYTVSFVFVDDYEIHVHDSDHGDNSDTEVKPSDEVSKDKNKITESKVRYFERNKSFLEKWLDSRSDASKGESESIPSTPSTSRSDDGSSTPTANNPQNPTQNESYNSTPTAPTSSTATPASANSSLLDLYRKRSNPDAVEGTPRVDTATLREFVQTPGTLDVLNNELRKNSIELGNVEKDGENSKNKGLSKEQLMDERSYLLEVKAKHLDAQLELGKRTEFKDIDPDHLHDEISNLRNKVNKLHDKSKANESRLYSISEEKDK